MTQIPNGDTGTRTEIKALHKVRNMQWGDDTITHHKYSAEGLPKGLQADVVSIKDADGNVKKLYGMKTKMVDGDIELYKGKGRFNKLLRKIEPLKNALGKAKTGLKLGGLVGVIGFAAYGIGTMFQKISHRHSRRSR